MPSAIKKEIEGISTGDNEYQDKEVKGSLETASDCSDESAIEADQSYRIHMD